MQPRLKQNQSDLLARGYECVAIQLPAQIREKVESRDWVKLDQLMQNETRAGGVIFERLKHYADFSEIEFIISIRSSEEFPDEDGIWHDDGSRILAFSLSLTLEPSAVQGGRLEIKKFGHPESEKITTPAYGSMIVFATGQHGFEHKINRVSQGERIIIAGWCT
jgi:hypothetical protein